MDEDEKSKQKSPDSDFIGPREPTGSRAKKVDLEEPAEDLAEIDQPLEDKEPEPEQPAEASHRQRFRRWYGGHKRLTIPLTILVVMLALAAIPFTRYSVAAIFISHDISLQVLDSETGAPVSDAAVQASGGAAGTTNGNGYATLKDVAAGNTTLSAVKKYYKDARASVTVSVLKPKNAFVIKLEATGRQTKIKVLNTITQKPLSEVEIGILDIKAKTDQSGEAIVVLPVGTNSEAVKLSLDGYNDAAGTVAVSETEIKENNFKLTPAGKIYFLSNRSGKLDVMKANLDGSEAKVVLAGTGSEDPGSTALIASPDWKYLALLSRRDGSKPRLYIITTTDDKLTIADEGSASFTLSGWLGSRLIYSLSRTDLDPWQTGAGKLKSYDANTGKITTLDQTTGSGDAGSNIYEYYNFIFLSGDTVTFAKGWTTLSFDAVDFTGKTETLSSISASGQNHKVVASYDAVTKAVDYSAHLPNSVYILTNTLGDDDYSYFDYLVDSTPKQITLSFDQFYKAYPTFYVSQDSKKTVWTELRDGKNAIIIGDADGSSDKAIASLSGDSAFGWYGQQYVLLNKDGSELYIIGVEGGTPLKITDYEGNTYYANPPITTY